MLTCVFDEVIEEQMVDNISAIFNLMLCVPRTNISIYASPCYVYNGPFPTQ